MTRKAGPPIQVTVRSSHGSRRFMPRISTVSATTGGHGMKLLVFGKTGQVARELARRARPMS